MPVLHNQVEWDTTPSFNSMGNKPLSYDADLGTSPEVIEIDADGSGRYPRVHVYVHINKISGKAPRYGRYWGSPF